MELGFLIAFAGVGYTTTVSRDSGERFITAAWGVHREEPLQASPLGGTRDTSFVDDLHVDSLDTVELLAAIEDEFALTIPNDKVTALETVGELIDHIADHT